MWTECANKPNYFIAFLTVKLLTSPTNKDPNTKTCNGFSLLKALLLFTFNQFPKLRGDTLLCTFFDCSLRKTSESKCGIIISFINFSSTTFWNHEDPKLSSQYVPSWWKIIDRNNDATFRVVSRVRSCEYCLS